MKSQKSAVHTPKAISTMQRRVRLAWVNIRDAIAWVTMRMTANAIVEIMNTGAGEVSIHPLRIMNDVIDTQITVVAKLKWRRRERSSAFTGVVIHIAAWMLSGGSRCDFISVDSRLASRLISGPDFYPD
jgi:hypothetical protein